MLILLVKLYRLKFQIVEFIMLTILNVQDVFWVLHSRKVTPNVNRTVQLVKQMDYAKIVVMDLHWLRIQNVLHTFQIVPVMYTPNNLINVLPVEKITFYQQINLIVFLQFINVILGKSLVNYLKFKLITIVIYVIRVMYHLMINCSANHMSL